MNIRTKGAALGVALVLSSPVWADDVPPPAAEAKAEVTWEGDFDKAVAEAKKEHKDLFIDFTGSDWCGWCIKLHEEVFSHDDFLAAAQKDYVLVALDYPHSDEAKAKVPNQARNDELAKTHKIGGYPTILLMTADGDVFGRGSYQPGGSAKYVEYIAKLRADGKPALISAKAILAELAAAKDGEKAPVLEKAATALGALDPGAATAEMLSEPVKAAFESDPENKSGLRVRAAKALLKTGTADEGVMDAATTLDPKNEKGLLEYVVAAKTMTLRSLDDVKAWAKSCDDLFALGEPKDKKVGKQLAANCMFMNFQHLKDQDKAKVYAKKVQDYGFETGDERLKMLVDKVLGTDAPAKPAK